MADDKKPGEKDEPRGAGPRVARVAFGDVELAVVSSPIRGVEGLDELTAAEREVCSLLVMGNTNEAIAEKRGTAVRTVANQASAIYRKLGVFSRSELTARLLGSAPDSIPAKE